MTFWGLKGQFFHVSKRNLEVMSHLYEREFEMWQML
jgi:hypothetical protein